MRIILDGMGGDHAPEEVVKGAVLASEEINHQITIIGREDEINKQLKKYKYNQDKITVVNADEVITNDDAPVRAVRTKKQSSIVQGLTMVKNGEGDVFVSAGSTGALLAGGLLILGRVHGIDRPALATVYPVLGKAPALLVDAGANAECKPNNLLEFGIMGSIYMEKVLHRELPRVGLVNIGTEEGKGTTLTKEAFELLKKSHLHFVGNVEAREIPRGICDVIVADGFTGNVLLKLTEGFGLTMMKSIKQRFTDGGIAKLGAALLKDKLRGLKEEFDYSEYGGAPILGVKGPMIKMHGSSDAKAVKNAILMTIPYVEGKVVETIENSVLEIEEIVLGE
ncbi:MAG TPA: phosphate acyltransferase PlsX [Anaerovoracaceae bacterium]|nr:phosphate acyltransferase PlsX [Anaerovoracaceae bacterium]